MSTRTGLKPIGKNTTFSRNGETSGSVELSTPDHHRCVSVQTLCGSCLVCPSSGIFVFHYCFRAGYVNILYFFSFLFFFVFFNTVRFRLAAHIRFPHKIY